MIETNKTMYQDFPFMCEVMSRAKRISVEKDYLVHYRLEENQNSSTKQRGEKLIQMASRCIDGIEILENNGVLDLCKEEIYFHAWTANRRFFHDIMWEYKGKYFDELYRLFQPLKKECRISFKHFTPEQRKFVLYVWGNDFQRATQHKWHFSIVNLRRFFISLRLPSEHFTGWLFEFFGFQIGSHLDFNRPALCHMQIGMPVSDKE
jgi:hypothetical protein